MNVEMIEQASTEIAELLSADYPRTMDVIRLRECLDYKESTGDLFWMSRPVTHFKTRRDRNAWNTRNAGNKAGVVKKDGRIELTIDNKKFRAHRAIWAIYYGEWPATEVDHADVNPSNNAIGNLRLATRKQNQRNMKFNVNTNTSGFKGVTWISAKGRYKAQIKIGGRCLYLGLFTDPADAHKAYCEAANKHHGDFANHGN